MISNSFVTELQSAGNELSTQFIDLIDSLSTLRDLMELNVQYLDERTLVRQALLALMHNQDVERCSLFLLNGQRLVNVTGVDWSECDAPLGVDSDNRPAMGAHEFDLGEGIIGKAALTRTLLHCRDCYHDTQFKAKGNQVGGPGCLISAPILTGDELMGVLNISHPQPNHFTEWHERLLGVYCSLLALMLKNNRLVHHLERAVQVRTLELERSLEEARVLKQRYEALSLVDELTNLYNRRYFFPQANIAFARALRYDEPLAILLLDLDFFKTINDQYGHAAGDEVLSSFAAMLQQQVRDSDILARMGGEEFAIIAVAIHREQVIKFAERVCQAARTLTIHYDAQPLRVTVSIGVAVLDHLIVKRDKWTVDTLLAQADQALYQAKREGRNRVVVSGNA